MKKILMTLIATAMVIGASAQCDNDCKGKKDCHRPDRKEMAEHRKEMTAKRTQMMVEKYNLTPEQATKLNALNEKYAPKGGHHHGHHHGMKPGERPEPQNGKDGMKPEPPKDKKDFKKMREERHKAYDKELQSILTPEQYKAYKADMKAQRKAHKHHKK
ncbi:MAG: DUF4890 domain-containing protein [Prevotella sp.]|nr:DUF4890 domain-containing protein [Prevotella sp.]